MSMVVTIEVVLVVLLVMTILNRCGDGDNDDGGGWQ